jgi:hypothetical protein
MSDRTPMKKMAKVGLVIAGFILAFAGACLAAYLDDLATARFNDQSGGMVAGGEMILFIGVFAFLSVFPTALALYFLRSEDKFWNAFSIFAIGLALTGPIAEVYIFLVRIFTSSAPSLWAFFSFFALLRVWGTFVLGFGDILFAFITTLPQARKRLLIAAGIESALLLYVAVHFLIWHNFS